MALVSSHANGVEFMHGLTFGNTLLSKSSLGVGLSELGQSMNGIFLQPNGLILLYDEYIKVLNNLMEIKDL